MTAAVKAMADAGMAALPFTEQVTKHRRFTSPWNAPCARTGFASMRTTRLRRSRQNWAECREALRHLRLRGFVESYVDGELTDTSRARFVAHLARCWACSGQVETLQLIKHSLQTRPQRGPVPLAEIRIRRFADRLATTPAVEGDGPRT